MSLTALIETGERVYAPDLYNTKQTFSCPFCKNKLLFVNSTLRIKHFRHSIKANCPYGNETKEHEATKNYVFEELKKIPFGKAYLEYTFDQFIADVYFCRPNSFDIAFEIQATNYSYQKYIDKISHYIKEGLLVVYIFIGENFYKEVKANIFSLKEIEKLTFIKNDYKGQLQGCYLSANNAVTLPAFTAKFAKGNSQLYCTTRFIMQYKQARTMTLKDYVAYIATFYIDSFLMFI